jgi:predicted transposase YdaD
MTEGYKGGFHDGKREGRELGSSEGREEGEIIGFERGKAEGLKGGLSIVSLRRLLLSLPVFVFPRYNPLVPFLL